MSSIEKHSLYPIDNHSKKSRFVVLKSCSQEKNFGFKIKHNSSSEDLLNN